MECRAGDPRRKVAFRVVAGSFLTGTTDPENVRAALELSALAEAANLSAHGGALCDRASCGNTAES